MPLPLEEYLQQSDLVKQAVVVGTNKKFCGLLVFPDLQSLCDDATIFDCSLPIGDFLQQPVVIDLYQTLVNAANQDLPSWSKVKRFRLVNGHFTVANGLLDSRLKIRRDKVNQVFANEINAMYREERSIAIASLENEKGRSFIKLVHLVSRKTAMKKTWTWLRSLSFSQWLSIKIHKYHWRNSPSNPRQSAD